MLYLDETEINKDLISRLAISEIGVGLSRGNSRVED